MEYSTRADYVVSPFSSVENLATTIVRPSDNKNRANPTPSSPALARGRPRNLSLTGRLREGSSPSTTSSEPDDIDYNTDCTSPAVSETGADEACPDEVESFRDAEWPMLKGNVYLDNAGSAIPTASLIRESAADLIDNLYGNPHSDSAPAAAASHKIHSVRTRVLKFFNANPDEWDMVFTANATAAIKLVIESMRDHASTTNTPLWYGYHKDAHTSLVGIRELTKMHRCFASDDEVDKWIASGGIAGPRARQLGLFAYPGQSNMTGRRLPYAWCGRIRKNLRKAKTYTLYDAAAHASTAQMDLSDTSVAPDFVAASFYKIFGKPDIGCLLIQKESAEVFGSRRYFGGGTVEMIISLNDTWHAKKEELHERLEDGTLPFHSIVELDHALNVHERLFGHMPMKAISQHTGHLAKMMYDRLSTLRHANGASMLKVYKDEKAQYGDPSTQGATMAFNILAPDGRMWGYQDVENTLNEAGIYVRSGSLCNPGGMASHLGWSAAEMRKAYEEGHRCSDPVQVLHGKATGVVRASIGAHNIADDILRFVKFMEETYIDHYPATAAVEEVRERAERTPKPGSLAAPSLSGSATPTASLSAHGTPTPTHNFSTPMRSRPTDSKPPLPPPQDEGLPRHDSATHGFPNANSYPLSSRSTPAVPSAITDLTSASPPLLHSQYSSLPFRSRQRRSLHHRAAKGMGMEIKVNDVLAPPPPVPPTPHITEYHGNRDDGESDRLSSAAGTSVRSRRRFRGAVEGLLGLSKG